MAHWMTGRKGSSRKPAAASNTKNRTSPAPPTATAASGAASDSRKRKGAAAADASPAAASPAAAAAAAKTSSRKRKGTAADAEPTASAAAAAAAVPDAAGGTERRKKTATVDTAAAAAEAPAAAAKPATTQKTRGTAAENAPSAGTAAPAAATASNKGQARNMASPAAAAAAGSSSAATLYAIKISRSTEVTDYDWEGQDGIDWEEDELFNPGLREDLQDKEAQAADGIWYYTTRGRPLTPAPPPKSTPGLPLIDPHFERIGDSEILVPKMEGPVVVFKSLEAANAKAEDVMKELLTEQPFEREVPEDTYAKGIRGESEAAAKGKKKSKGSRGRRTEATPAAADARGWQSTVTNGCVALTATRHYLLKIWEPVDTIVCSEVKVVVELAQCRE